MDCTKPILNVPSKNIPQPEDTMPAPDEEDGLDDSDVPIQSVINNIIHKTVPKGYAISPNGSIEANIPRQRGSVIERRLATMALIRTLGVGNESVCPTADTVHRHSGAMTTQIMKWLAR